MIPLWDFHKPLLFIWSMQFTSAMRDLPVLLFSLCLMLSFLVIMTGNLPSNTAAYAHIYSNITQVWIDRQNNIKIQFSHLPEKPTMNDLIQLEFSIQNLQTGNHLKNLISKVTVANNPIYKFDNITVADGDFSIRCPSRLRCA
jgi:hypothetical protein